jgi:hypothetical protein
VFSHGLTIRAVRLHRFDLRPNIDAILNDGFRAGDVWLSDLSLLDDADPPLGAEFAHVVVDAPEDEIAEFEVVGNPDVRPGSHREWRIPAASSTDGRAVPSCRNEERPRKPPGENRPSGTHGAGPRLYRASGITRNLSPGNRSPKS